MNALLVQQIQTFVRRYWQHSVLGVLALLVLLQVVSWAGTMMDLRRIDHLIATAQDPNATISDSDEQDDQNRRENQREPNEREIKKDIFRRENIPYELTAIFMDQAVIDENVVKEGDRVGKAEVKEIGLDYVIIQEDGKNDTRTLTLFDQRGGPRMASNNSRGRGRPDRSDNQRERPSSSDSSGNIPEPPGQEELSVENITWEQIQNMSPEERRERFMSLSEDQRQELRDRFRSQIREQGGRGGFRGRGGPPPGGRFGRD